MGLWDFLRKKEIPPEEVALEVAKKEVQRSEDPYHTEDARALVRKLPIDLASLRLEEIERNAETVVNYLQVLIQDLVGYGDAKEERARERYKQSIAKKVKVIAQRGLEVRNLVAHLEAQYFQVLIDVLDQLHALTKDPFLVETKRRLEAEVAMGREVEAKLFKVIAYDERLNAEKNPHFGEEIAKAAQAREIHKDVQEVLKILQREVTDRKQGLVARIRQEKIMEALRIKVTV